MADITQVLRLPENPLGSGARAGDVVIAMKTSHIKRRPGGRALEPTTLATSTLEDKAKFAAYMAASGFADYCPQTYADRQEAIFPCILKRTDLSASLGVAIVSVGGTSRRAPAQPDIRGASIHPAGGCCRQRRIRDLLRMQGWARAVNCSFATDVRDPMAIKREDNALPRPATGTPDAVVRQIETVLSPLAHSGPCNVDYKLSADGRMKIFEINPRRAAH